MKKAPIVFIAHNRPDYFIQCVNSLAGQCEDREVFLFYRWTQTTGTRPPSSSFKVVS